MKTLYGFAGHVSVYQKDMVQSFMKLRTWPANARSLSLALVLVYVPNSPSACLGVTLPYPLRTAIWLPTVERCQGFKCIWQLPWSEWEGLPG